MKALGCGILFLFVLGLLGALATCRLASDWVRSVQPPVSRIQPPTFDPDRGLYRVPLQWTDLNAKASPREAFTLEAQIPEERLQAAINSFGVSKHQASFSYRSTREREAMAAELQRHAFEHGFKYDLVRNLEIDFQWILDHSRQDLAPFHKELSALARGRAYQNRREYFGLVSSLIQSLEYRIPPKERINPDGRQVLTGGINMPLETLANRWGDCDTRCVLLASILGNIRGTRYALLLGDQHAFLGLPLSPQWGDRYIVAGGETFVLVELTAKLPLGTLPQDMWAKVQGKVYQTRLLNE